MAGSCRFKAGTECSTSRGPMIIAQLPGRFVVLALTALALAVPALAVAAVPTTSAVEGVMLSTSGGPAADGSYTLAFSIYASETGGSAVWTEAGVAVTAKGGQFSYQLGSKTPLSAAVLSLPKAWIGVQIGTDPELSRRPLTATPYALRAAIADGLDCSGCLQAANLDAAVLQPYAKAAELGEYVKASSLAKAAGTGSYNDLNNKPVLVTLGAACGTNLVMKGIKADGSYECVSTGVAPDLLNEISNDLLWNQFVDKVDGTKDVQIKDGFPAGVTDTLTFPDIGLAQKIWVDFSVGNSDLSKVIVELYGPGIATPYILYNGTKSGTSLTAVFNDTDPIDTGDMDKDWLGKNIKGNWSITVKDTKAISLPPGTPPFVYDGKFSWAISIQTLSNKKVQLKGNLIIDGTVKANGVQLGGDPAKCDASKQGTLRYTAAKGAEICIGTFWVAAAPKPAIYSGFCSKHGTGAGWNAYCLDGTAINTAEDYLAVSNPGGGVITVKVPGFYRVHLNILYNNCWNQDGVQLLKNGGRIGSGYSSAASGVWGMHIVDETWPFAAGDTIQVQAYNSGCSGYAYHQGSASGVWSKVSVHYIGSL